MNPFLIDLHQLPAEGKTLQGRQPAGFFELSADDLVAGPLDFQLQLVREGDNLHVAGRLEASFDLQCGRCLARFPYRVELANYAAELPVENGATIDLTETLREDILLALPNFPRCEDGNVEPRDCPAEGRFDSTPPADETGLPGAERGIWNALDQLK
jgi:uncharacterized metal-binding protein YceD (DUF177 family)